MSWRLTEVRERPNWRPAADRFPAAAILTNTRIAANLSMGVLSRKTERCLAKSPDTHQCRETLCLCRWTTEERTREDLRIRRRSGRRLHGGGTRIGGS